MTETITPDDIHSACDDEEAGSTFAELAAWMEASADEQHSLARQYCDSDEVAEHQGAESALLECARQVRRVLALRGDAPRLALVRHSE